jgi:predicted component of type VI protein secretion system
MGVLMPAQLTALTDGPNIVLDKPILLIGRHPESDIQINSRKISRLHCVVAQVSDYLVVRDLGSTNGVRINGVRVLDGKLRDGDELTIGNHRYKVQWESLAPAPRLPAEREKPTAKDTERPAPPFESCEEPVPLSDAEGVAPAAPMAKGVAPRAKPAPPPARNDPRVLMLPDDFRIASSPDAGRQSSSHFPRLP